MMNHSTRGLYQRYQALCRVFPPFTERQVHIIDFGPWGCFSAVIENGVTTHYDYDIENPDRYCPNRKDQPDARPEQPKELNQPTTQPNRSKQPDPSQQTASEPPSFSSRVPEDPANAFTRRDYQPAQPSDPVLYDHLTKFDKGPPLDPPLWETWSQQPPIREGPPLPDNPAGRGIPASGELRLLEPPPKRKRR